MRRHEELFENLQDVDTLQALIGTTEDLHLDCKLWPQRDDDAQRMIAKAICGFANADGGVILVGFEAKGGPTKYDADVIQRAVPVTDAVLVKSRIEGLVGDLVEPRVSGVRAAAVFEAPGSKEGFVLVCVPATEGTPCRSRKHHDFFQRISSGTYPMEYFQIADMFGRRHRPQLALYLEEGRFRAEGTLYERELTIGIVNKGRAIARFPSIRFKRVGINVNGNGIDGNGGFGLPQLATEPELIAFGGGADHVIYPGTVLKIAKLDQRAKGSDWIAVRGGRQTFFFAEYTLTVEISASDVPTIEDSRTIPRTDIPS